MTDHETYLLLAARQINEGLTPSQEADLDAHLATCPSCRTFIAGMRRDDILLRGQLGEVAVAPRVRQRVLDEAYGNRRRFDPRIILALAATLLLASIGIPLIVGSQRSSPAPIAIATEATPSPTPSSSPSPSGSPPSSPEPSVSLSLPPTPPPGSGAFVAAHYVYNEQVPRRDTISARFDAAGDPTGEWTRTIPAPRGTPFAGPVTCLVIEGNKAWLAGPATTTDGTRDSAYVHLVDGGPGGADDRAIMWMNNPGESLQLLEGWCRDKFVPDGPFPLTNGEIEIDDGSP
jgi:hypothetical protein